MIIFYVIIKIINVIESVEERQAFEGRREGERWGKGEKESADATSRSRDVYIGLVYLVVSGGKESKAVEFPLFPVSGPRGPYGVSRGGQYLHITTSWRGDHRRWHKILLCCLLSPREPRVAL